MAGVDSFCHEDDPRIGRMVRDVASKGEGRLTAIVRERADDMGGGERFVRVAYVKGTDGVEWSTAADNVSEIR